MVFSTARKEAAREAAQASSKARIAGAALGLRQQGLELMEAAAAIEPVPVADRIQGIEEAVIGDAALAAPRAGTRRQ